MKNNDKPYSISIRVDPDIARPLRIASIDEGLSINWIVNRAVRDWLKNMEKRTGKSFSSPPAPNNPE